MYASHWLGNSFKQSKRPNANAIPYTVTPPLAPLCGAVMVKSAPRVTIKPYQDK